MITFSCLNRLASRRHDPLVNPSAGRLRVTGPAPALGRCAALALVAACTAGPASAAPEYRAQAFIELRVNGYYGNEVVMFHDPPTGNVRSDPSYVQAGREYVIGGEDGYGFPLVAGARATSDASGYGIGAQASSNRTLSPNWLFWTSWAQAQSSAGMQLITPIAGAPGQTGTVVVSGLFLGGVSPPAAYPQGSGMNMGAGVWLSRTPAGSSTCVGTCGASDRVDVRLSEGAMLDGLIHRPWRLELPVIAGDTLLFGGSVGISVTAGYAGYLRIAGVGPDELPLQGSWAAAAGSSGLQPESAGGLQAAGSFVRIELSPGLELADLEGLVRLADGSYGLATPVPEPATWALWGVAGALAWLRRRRLAG